MKTQVIRLESHDDATSIRDKIAWSRAARILLAFPKHRKLVLCKLDLSLIHREAARLGGQLALVTRDADVGADAEELGIPVFSSITQSQKRPWIIPRQQRRFTPRETRLADLETRNEEVRSTSFTVLPPKVRMAAFTTATASLFILILFFSPSATITVSPQRTEQKLTLDVWASPGISAPAASGAMPSAVQSLIVESSMEGDTTASITLPDNSASGKVVLTNLTQSEVIVPAGTVFLAGGETPVRFVSTDPVTLPAGIGISSEVDIHAQSPGVQGNVAENRIQAIEGQVGLSAMVTNPSPTSGGSDRLVRAASQQDYNRLYDSLLTSLSESALQKMKTAAGSQQTLIPSTFKVKQILQDKRSPAIGEPADRIRIDLRLEFSAMTVKQTDLQQVARLALDAGLPPGYKADKDGTMIKITTVPFVGEDQAVHWTISASRGIYREFDAEGIVDQITGRSLVQAEQILIEQADLQGKTMITIAPAWWKRLPYIPSRIHLVEE